MKNKDLIESFSGIRGIFGQTITPNFAKKYAFVFGNWLANKLGKPAIIIGCDSRPSSEELKKAMIESLVSLGCKIIDVGVAPTPAISFGVREYGCEGGIYITASHNEPEYNGWKFLWRDGALLRPDQIKEVIEAVHKTKTLPGPKVVDKVAPKPKAEIVNRHKDLIQKYVNFVLDLLGKEAVQAIKKTKLKIVVDPNGGAATTVIKQILDGLGIEGVYLNMGLGEFKRKVEPIEESLAYLVDVIKKEKADLAAGWDSDADRCEIVLSEKFLDSYVVSGNYVLALLVDSVLTDLEDARGKIIVTNDATSNIVRRTAKRFGANVKEVEVGEINVVEEMYRLDSPVGGEGSSSGGIFPPQRCRDGMVTLAMILKLIAKQGQSLAEILTGYPKYYAKATKVKCDPEKQVEIRKRLEEHFEKNGFKTQKTGDETGGLKILVTFDSFIFFRASKTEPGIFRIITDSPEKIETERLLKMGRGAFENVKRLI